MTYIKINNTLYPASVVGKISDKEWDGRESKTITLEMEYDAAFGLFIDGLIWSIVRKYEVDGEEKEVEYDNSEFVLAGDITNHRDGTITVKMGKLTALEEAYEMMLGGVK